MSESGKDGAAVVPEPTSPERDAPGTGSPDATLRAVETRIDNLIVSNHALAFRLGEEKPPYTAGAAEGIRHFRPGPSFEVWLVWCAVERLRVANETWRGTTTPVPDRLEKPEAPSRLF